LIGTTFFSLQKVFPESASLANGAKQIGSADLPSDDSEDNDYDPTLAEGNMVDENKSSAEDGDEGSDSDDLDFMTSSDDSEPSTKKSSKSKKNTTVDDLGLPSEDSEDDDFDPEGPDSSEDQKTKTNSEESDFTSDSDDFCAEISKSCGKDELAPPFSDQTDGVEIMEAELEQDLVLPASSRRQVGRLDYKTLYDVCLLLAFLHVINVCFSYSNSYFKVFFLFVFVMPLARRIMTMCTQEITQPFYMRSVFIKQDQTILDARYLVILFLGEHR
jgi:hypothetical protein